MRQHTNKVGFSKSSLAVALSLATFGGGAHAAALEEVIVTANKRSESIQDSSLIVSAFGAEEIRNSGIGKVGDLNTIEPGLQVGMGGPALQVYIRGVGNPGSTAVTNPAVAVNKGGVYVARSQAAAASFFDLERIEVLKGPQGTLYGRNATGGAINLITQSPVLGQSEGFVSFDAGNYNLLGIEAAANIPVSDTVALRGSLNNVERDGYMSDGTGDEDKTSVRLQMLWEPSDKFSLLISGQHSEIGGKGPGHTYVGSSDPWESILSPGANAVLLAGAQQRNFIAPASVLPPFITGPVVGTVPAGPFAGQNLISLVNPKVPGDIFQDMEFTDISATINWDLGFATLTAIPAYQEAEMHYVTHPGLRYETFDPLTGEPESSETFSLEMRLSNETDNLKWVVGAYSYDEAQAANVRVNQGALQNLAILSDYDTESLGLFGEVTLSLTDELRLIAGARYSDDETTKSDFRRIAITESLACNTLLPPGAPGAAQTFATGVVGCLISASPDETVTFDSTDWKVGVEFDLSDETLLFASASTGYKAGGIAQVAGQAFRPEELTAYELGVKTTMLDGRLRVNADVFYWDYTDHQEFVIGPDELGITGQGIINAGSATIQGAGFDITYAVTDSGILTLGAEYLDGTYDDFKYRQSAQFTAPNVSCARTPTGNFVNVGQGPFPELEIDCSGFQMVNAPEWVASASYTQGFDLGDSGRLEASVDVSHTGPRPISANFLREDFVDEHTIVNARLSYYSPEESVSVTAYVKNLTEDDRYFLSLNHSQVSNLVGQAVGEPTMAGVRVRFSF